MKLIYLAASILLAARAASAEIVEQWCVDHPSECKCSEPLDFTGSVTLTGGNRFDFPNSEGAGAKECGPSGEAYFVLNPPAAVGPTSASSVGLSGPTNVLDITMYQSSNIEDTDRSFTNGTYCQRIYFRFSSGFPAFHSGFLANQKGPRNENNNEGTDGTDHPGVESAWTTNGNDLEFSPGFHFPDNCPSTPCNGGAFGPSFPSTGDSVSVTDCTNNWCRQQVCYDHNEGGNAKMRARARIEKLDIDDTTVLETESVNTLLNGTTTSITSGTSSHLLKTFINNNPNGTDGQHVYASHAITAIWATADSSKWIGAASEIGAGGAGATLKAPVLRP